MINTFIDKALFKFKLVKISVMKFRCSSAIDIIQMKR